MSTLDLVTCMLYIYTEEPKILTQQLQHSVSKRSLRAAQAIHVQ